MDSLSFWIYLIVAAIYLISRALKKAAPKPPPGGRRQERTESAADDEEGYETNRPPMSFEELLREITESRKPTPASPPPDATRTPAQQRQRIPQPTLQRRPEPPKPAYVDYDDDIKEENQDLEDENIDYRGKGSVYETFENARRDAFSRPSLEEAYTMGKPGELARETEYERFGAFSIRQRHSILNDYIQELKSPSGFKKAIVLSEILKRKY